MVLIVALAVAVTTIGVLIVLSVALVRHVKLLSSSVSTFRDQVRPDLQDITAGAAAMQERLDRMSRRADERKR